MDDIKSDMLDRVARSDGHFKQQQKGEAEIDYEEKLRICSDMLEAKPVAFLTQYGQFLSEEDLNCFSSSDNETVKYQIDNMKKNYPTQSKSEHQCVWKNRRYKIFALCL